MIQDLKYAWRMLLRQKGVTVVAILSLGLGIGATTTVFSLLNAAILRPLPVKDPATLVAVYKPDPNSSGIHAISYPDYLDYRSRNEVFSDMLVWCETPLSLNISGQTEPSYGMVVSGNYFSMLGVQPAAGRFFSPEEDQTPAAYPVAVISYALWQTHFAGNSAVIGQTVKLSGQPFTIIGVAPKGFTSTFSVFAPALYVPLMMQARLMAQPDIFGARMSKYLKITGRLKPGITREQAQASLTLLDRQLEQAYPEQGETSTKPNQGLELLPVGSFPWDLELAIAGIAASLFAVVGSVLLIACANVAGILLARATARRREVAVRLALGATRKRLIRQLLTENTLLFLLAAVVGTALTIWLTRVLSTISLPAGLPFALDVKVDWRVLAFTLLLALLTGIVFGLAPALEAARTDLNTSLKDAPRLGVFRRSRLRQIFVAGQIALSLTLLVSAGLFTRALEFAQTIYPGREPESVLTIGLDPARAGYDRARAEDFYQQLTRRVEALPGVESVSMVQFLQVADGGNSSDLKIRDLPNEAKLTTESNRVAPRYFQTMGIAQLSGRDFAATDRKGAPPVVIVNQAFARRFWNGASALGKQVSVGGSDWAEIVGVVEDSRYRVSGKPAAPVAYYPYTQSGSNNLDMTLVLRNRGNSATTLSAVRREVESLDPDLPVLMPMTLVEYVRTVTLPWRLAGTLTKVFGLIGLSLAALGIYGLGSYTVSQRTNEIGVRMALGARRQDIFRLILGQSFKLAAVGVTIGLVLSFLVTRSLTDFLFGLSASDPTTYLSITALLVLVSLSAALVPARRATKVDPLVSLRHE
jgi:predicted permease